MTTYRVEMSVIRTTKHNVYKNIEADSFDEAKTKAKELVEDFGDDVIGRHDENGEITDVQLNSVMTVVDNLDINIINNTESEV